MVVVPIQVEPVGGGAGGGGADEFIVGEQTPTVPIVLNTANPQLIGIGPAKSRITFPTAIAAEAAITIENVETDVTLDTARVDNLRISGGNEGITESWSPADPYSCNGIHLGGQHCSIVSNNRIIGWRGNAVKLRTGGWCRNNRIRKSFTGIQVIGADVMVSDNWVDTNRDYCLWCAGGNFHSQGNHYYGASKEACRLDTFGTFPNTTSATVGKFVGDIFADAHTGIFSWTGNLVEFIGCSIAQNYERAVYISQHSANISFYNCLIEVAAASTPGHTLCNGCEFHGARCSINDSQISVTDDFGGGALYGPAKFAVKLVAVDPPTGGGTTNSRAHGFQSHGTYLVDADGMNGSNGYHINGPVRGAQVDNKTVGWHDATAKLLVCDGNATVGMRGCSFVFRGTDDGETSIDLTQCTKYVTMTGTTGIHASNEIVLINSMTGAAKQLLTGPTVNPTLESSWQSIGTGMTAGRRLAVPW